MLRDTLAVLKLKLCLFANKSFDGFENISKSFDLVKICTTGKLQILKSYTTFMLNTFSFEPWINAKFYVFS